MWSLRDVFKRWAFAVAKRKTEALLLRDVIKRWAFVVEKRKTVALLERISPYQHLDTDDELSDDDGSSECEGAPWVQPIVAYIKLPRPAG